MVLEDSKVRRAVEVWHSPNEVPQHIRQYLTDRDDVDLIILFHYTSDPQEDYSALYWNLVERTNYCDNKTVDVYEDQVEKVQNTLITIHH